MKLQIDLATTQLAGWVGMHRIWQTSNSRWNTLMVTFHDKFHFNPWYSWIAAVAIRQWEDDTTTAGCTTLPLQAYPNFVTDLSCMKQQIKLPSIKLLTAGTIKRFSCMKSWIKMPWAMELLWSQNKGDVTSSLTLQTASSVTVTPDHQLWETATKLHALVLCDSTDQINVTVISII